MDKIYSVIFLLSAVGLFLYAITLASKGMEKFADKRLRSVLNKSSSSPLVGVGIGTVTTALIQSSSATTVMIVGLVNAGIIGLLQATYMIMGANIGTTITAHIASLQTFEMSNFLMLFVFIGLIIRLLGKKDRLKALGDVLIGFGMMFIALSLMSSAIKDLSDTSFFTSLLPSITNPLLLLLIGIIFTTIMQSSSAVTGILIALAIAGISVGNGGNSLYYVILGTNIGTCTTALLSIIGSKSNGKRAAIIHLLFNMIGSIVFFIFLLIYKNFAVDVMEKLFDEPSTQIAMFHTLFNVVSTLILLPFAKVLVRIANKLVKDDKDKKYSFTYIDDRLLNTPFIATSMINKEIGELIKKVEDSFVLAIDDFLNKDDKNKEKVIKIRNDISLANYSLTEYLIKLSSSSKASSHEKRISSYHHVLSDIDRISDLCISVLRLNEMSLNSDISYSLASYNEILSLKEDLLNISSKVYVAFVNRDKSKLVEIEEIEDGIDLKRGEYASNHIKRLNNNECSASSSTLYTSLLNSLERMGDHYTFIARSLIEVAHKN